MIRDESYFMFQATGRLIYDQGRGRKASEPWWARLHVNDSGLAGYYAWLSKSWGMKLMKGNANGTHITIVRGEQPLVPQAWGLGDGDEVAFWYSHSMRWTPFHVWVDVYSERLAEIRAVLGLPEKLQKVLSDGRVLTHSFHMTIGRRV